MGYVMIGWWVGSPKYKTIIQHLIRFFWRKKSQPFEWFSSNISTGIQIYIPWPLFQAFLQCELYFMGLENFRSSIALSIYFLLWYMVFPNHQELKIFKGEMKQKDLNFCIEKRALNHSKHFSHLYLKDFSLIFSRHILDTFLKWYPLKMAFKLGEDPLW